MVVFRKGIENNYKYFIRMEGYIRSFKQNRWSQGCGEDV